MNEETNPSPSAHSTPYQPRRKFLKMLGFGSAFAITHPVLGQVRFRAIDPSKVQLDKTKLDLPQPIRPDYTPVHLLRPEDLLSLELRFHGFIRQGQLLKRVQETAHLVVVFPPQSITEQSWKESATALETPTLPGAMFIGDTSRLVFSIPPSLTELPLDSQTLLTWDRFEPAVSPRARPASTRKVTRPANISARLKDVEEQISKSTFRLHPALTQDLSKSERELLQSMMVKERPGLSRRDAIRALPKFQAVLSDERGAGTRTPRNRHRGAKPPLPLSLQNVRLEAQHHRQDRPRDHQGNQSSSLSFGIPVWQAAPAKESMRVRPQRPSASCARSGQTTPSQRWMSRWRRFYWTRSWESSR